MTESKSQMLKKFLQKEYELTKIIKNQFIEMLNLESFKILYILQLNVPKNIAEKLNYKIYTKNITKKIGYKNLNKMKLNPSQNKFIYEFDELHSLTIKFSFFEWYAIQFFKEKSINYTLKTLIAIKNQKLEFKNDLNYKFRNPIGFMIKIFTEPLKQNYICVFFKLRKEPIKYFFTKKSCIVLFLYFDQIQYIDFITGNYLVAIYNIFIENYNTRDTTLQNISFSKETTSSSFKMQGLIVQKYFENIKNDLSFFNVQSSKKLRVGYFIVQKSLKLKFGNIKDNLLENLVGIDFEICSILKVEKIKFQVFLYFEEIPNKLFTEIPFKFKAENIEKSVRNQPSTLHTKNIVFVNDQGNAAKYFIGKFQVKDPYFYSKNACEKSELTSKPEYFVVKRYCSIVIVF